MSISEITDDLRELAEWIHENIMGECVHDFSTLVDTKGNLGISVFAVVVVCKKCELATYIGDKTVEVPPYPTDIVEAWKVLEKLKATCPIIDIHWFYDCWTVMISRGGHTVALTEESNTLSEAICRLAKRAHKEGWLGCSSKSSKA